MKFFERIYVNLCNTRKENVANYGPKSGIHKHHIKPTHSGGLNEDVNYTYLSIREHIIAHYLLWKIHKNPNDLRSMHMLGARLTTEHRVIIGKWCYENKIGMYSSITPEQKKINDAKGLETQKQDYLQKGTKNWYYWSTPEGRLERSSLGGLKGGKILKENKKGIFDPKNKQKIIENNILNGKKTLGKKWLYDPLTNIARLIHPENELYKFLIKSGYILGHPPRKEKYIMYNNGSITKLIPSSKTNELTPEWIKGPLKKSNSN